MLSSIFFWIGATLIDLYAFLFLEHNLVYAASMPNGAKIVVANHPSTSDPFYFSKIFDEKFSMLLTGSAFAVPVFNKYLELAAHIPVYEGLGRKAYNQALKVLKNGGNIVIFPEGAISDRVEKVGKFKTGAVRLALEAKAPIVPVGIGLDQKRIRHAKKMTLNGKDEIPHWYFRGPYEVTVGKAIYFKGDVKDRSSVRKYSKQLMKKISALSKQSIKRLKDVKKK